MITFRGAWKWRSNGCTIALREARWRSMILVVKPSDGIQYSVQLHIVVAVSV